MLGGAAGPPMPSSLGNGEALSVWGFGGRGEGGSRCLAEVVRLGGQHPYWLTLGWRRSRKPKWPLKCGGKKPVLK